MSSSAAFQPQSHLADITSSAGYEALMGKLRLLKLERDHREQNVFPITMTKFSSAPSLAQSLESMAKAAYARNSRNFKSVEHLLSILHSGTTCTPAMSRSSSYTGSESGSAEVESEKIAPIPVFRHLVPGVLYECVQDEWIMAAKWVEELGEEDDE